MREVGKNIKEYSPKAFVIVVTNPLDAMVSVLREACGLPHNMVVGMAGVLDSARFNYFLAQEFNVAVTDVSSFVLGGHGDDMVPITRYTTVAGITLPDLLPADKVQQIVERTQKGGIEIVNLLGTGSAFYAPASSAVEMIEAILYDKKQILLSSCYLDGQYGIHGVFVGVPAKLGANGVEDIIKLNLTEAELNALKASADSVRKNVERMTEVTKINA
jgi:malate dehydrogenase